MACYDEVYRRAMSDPCGFWAEAATAISWYKPWQQVLDTSNGPVGRWFVGGELNSCYNAVDRHVEAGRGSQLALIYDSPMTGALEKLTYSQLLFRVARFAGALASLDVSKGDRVIIYMPMVPEAVIAMLACARLGAIHSVVFGGFAANELALRIDHAKPKLIVSASCGFEPNRIVQYKPLLDQAIQIAKSKPESCVVLQRESSPATLVAGRDYDWRELESASAPHPCVAVAATDPLYILYTSGTTGQPKGVVRDNGGHAVALTWTMKNIYNVEPGEVFWAASDVGWVVGHSYMVYAPLFHGCTTMVYEGKPVGTPDPGAFWRVISQHMVSVLFTAPAVLRVIRQQDPEGEYITKHELSQFRTLFLAGERCDPDTLYWAEKMLRVPAIDHWWQTETGWAIAANCLGIEALTVKPGSSARPAPGWDVQVVDPAGNLAKPGDIGAIVCKLPLPPGSFPALWEAEKRFQQSYLSAFPGYYQTGDSGYLDQDGYIYVMARTDDIINVAGHRLSTGALEEVLSAHPHVAECAVIGVKDPLKGEVPLGLLVLKNGSLRSSRDVVYEAIALVRQRVGPVAGFKQATVVQRLPKTRSGKILRATMKKIADAEPFRTPPTIEDPAVLDEIRDALGVLGYPIGEGSAQPELGRRGKARIGFQKTGRNATI